MRLFIFKRKSRFYKTFNLLKLYNLFSGANKMSYIDNFIDRNVGCQRFVNGLHEAICASKYHWFVN